MNYKSMGRFLSLILMLEAVFLLPVLILGLARGESAAVLAVLKTLGLILVIAGPLWLLTRRARETFHEKEALACTGLSWLVMGLLGCLPFYFSGEIPNFIDAFFETVSGFTTTGATILSEVESMSKCLLYWRCFTHWVGGMGVLVFLLAVSPAGGKGSGFTIHLMRAESPGPSVGKLVPQIRKTARILYMIYIGLTVLNIIALLIAGLPLFDSVCTAIGTAGTGGFAVTNSGLAGYSPTVQIVVTVFMFLFAINFSCHYLVLLGKAREVLKDEELRTFLLLVLAGVGIIVYTIRPLYGSFGEALRHAFFQVGSIASTTGFATADFNYWPIPAQGVLLFFMICGACAGSTCGGMKLIRLQLIAKNLRRNIRRMIRPGRVIPVRMNGQAVDEPVLANTNTYLAAYAIIILVSFLLLTPDMPDTTTGFTAVLTCFNNVGPGLNVVGPMGNFSGFSGFSKLVLIFDMLAGRLEIFPILALFSGSTWRHV